MDEARVAPLFDQLSILVLSRPIPIEALESPVAAVQAFRSLILLKNVFLAWIADYALEASDAHEDLASDQLIAVEALTFFK